MRNANNIVNNANNAISHAERALHNAAFMQASAIVPVGYIAATTALIKRCIAGERYAEPARLRQVLSALTEHELDALSPELRLEAFVHAANGGDVREWLRSVAARRRQKAVSALVALGFDPERAEALDDFELGDALQRARDWAD